MPRRNEMFVEGSDVEDSGHSSAGGEDARDESRTVGGGDHAGGGGAEEEEEEEAEKERDGQDGAEETWEVQKILQETFDEHGAPQYLLLWAGRPLAEASWEPRENIMGDLLLTEWEWEKREAAEGRAVLFDRDEWRLAKEEEAAAAAVERRKRDRSRAVTSQAPPSKKVRKKGIATKKIVPLSRRGGGGGSDSEEDGEVDEDGPASAPRETIQDAAAKVQSATASEPSLPVRVTSRKVKDKATTLSVHSNKKKTASARRTQETPAMEPEIEFIESFPAEASSGNENCAQSLAPSTKLSNPNMPSNNLADGSVVELKGRQLARMNDQKSKNAPGSRYSSLSELRRAQKNGRNEPDPDINSLVAVNPKTGNIEPFPKPSQSLPTAYKRRSPPRETVRPPDSPKTTPPRTIQPDSAPTVNPGRPLKRLCIEWVAGHCSMGQRCAFAHDIAESFKSQPCPFLNTKDGCRRTADECNYSHSMGDRAPLTCPFWAWHGCNKSAEDCMYAHYHTGHIAPMPGAARSSWVNPTVVQPSERDGSRSLSGAAAAASLPPCRSPALSIDTSLIGPPKNPSNRVARDSAVSAVAGAAPDFPATMAATMATTPPSVQVAGLAEAANADRNVSKRELVRQDALNLERSLGEIDIESLLFPGGRKAKRILLHFPRERKAERDILHKWFKSFPASEVYISSYPGHWKMFRDSVQDDGLIVVHPHETFLGSLSELGQFLTVDASIRVFALGYPGYELEDDGLGEGEGSLLDQQWFPYGGVTFISDDVFAYYPEKAAAIIDKYLERTKVKDIADELYRIGARPNIKSWYTNLAEKKLAEVNADRAETEWDWSHADALRAVEDIFPFEDEDARYFPDEVPKEGSYMWRPWMPDLPDLENLWETDEAAATELMVDWFAGNAVAQASKYRKWYFIYGRPEHEVEMENAKTGGTDRQQKQDPRRWMDRYNHIVVLTPDQMVLSKKKGE